MTLVARASKTVRNKNLIIAAMCVVFCGLFLKDGYHTYPMNNDLKVRSLLNVDGVSPQARALANEWIGQGGWERATGEMREKMDVTIKSEESHITLEGWKGPFDVWLQRLLAWCLLGCVGAATGWVVHCQRRRAIAEEGTVSPAPGVVIPWEKITRVDNTRWKTMGIVDITYMDEKGVSREADFDDYKLQREPLLAILDQLGEKAVNAEFLPKEEPAADVPAEEKPKA